MDLIQQNQIIEKEGIKISCHRCKYNWLYKGNNPFYCCCPYCRTTIKIGKNYNLKKERNEIV